MHDSVAFWAAVQIDTLTLAFSVMGRDRPRVLEVGSRDVNGSVRHHFDGWADYHGIDLVHGPGVDQVADVETFDAPGGLPYDLVVCLEVLEHTERPWVVLERIRELLDPQPGMLLLSTRGYGMELHHLPDYWRFGPGCLERLLAGAGFASALVDEDPELPGWLVLAKVSA